MTLPNAGHTPLSGYMMLLLFLLLLILIGSDQQSCVYEKMKQFLSKAKSTLQDLHDSTSAVTQASQYPIPQNQTIGPPTPTDVFRYRYHHGTNLGSIFVLEKWLSGSMFSSDSPGGAELDAVTTSVKKQGIEPSREKWEQHWHHAIEEHEFEWLVKEAKCTSIRLPIGYFTLGEQWCVGTPFEDVKGVYKNAWAAVRSFVDRARGWGIGVLIDFHAVQGGGNKEHHSGTTSGRADLWESRKHKDKARRALGFIAQEIRHGGLEGVIGIQVVNEAVHNAKGMYDWYEEVIREIGGVDDSIPIYISDGWDLETCLRWTNGRLPSKTSPRNPIVTDVHCYYTFSDKDRSQSPQEIISRIASELYQLDGKEGALNNKGEAQVVIGEWSCVLDGRTWSRVDPSDKPELVRRFGQAQNQKWQQRTGGCYFWTYKMDWMDGGEWGFAEQTKLGNIPAPQHLTYSTPDIMGRDQHAIAKRAEVGYISRTEHENYWNSTAPRKKFKHEWYSEGWEVGFSDAQVFFTMRGNGGLGMKAQQYGGGDRIGCADIWVKKRLGESGKKGEFVWEWEQGFRAGTGAYYQCVGI